MPDTPRSGRHWLERVRSLRDRATRERDRLCYVEGIRQVLSAVEGGHHLDALLVDPTRLKSTVAQRAVADLRERGVEYVELTTAEFERISARDNPVGIAAVVRWSARPLSELQPSAVGLYLVTDDIRDPGNLGTLVRTLDAAGGDAIIVHSGTDLGHPTALRASLGTTFHVPAYTANSLDEVFALTERANIQTVATSAKADASIWDATFTRPAAIFVGNEGNGLAASTLDRCDLRISIPMLGTATSLNVSVATGVVLYEIARQTMGRGKRKEESDEP